MTFDIEKENNKEYNKRKYTQKFEIKTKRQKIVKQIKDFLNENEVAKEEFINDIIYFLNPYYIDLLLFKKNLEKKNLLEEYINTALESFNFYTLKEIEFYIDYKIEDKEEFIRDNFNKEEEEEEENLNDEDIKLPF